MIAWGPHAAPGPVFSNPLGAECVCAREQVIQEKEGIEVGASEAARTGRTALSYRGESAITTIITTERARLLLLLPLSS